MTTAYPDALRADLQESINGYLVADPYRWLEDPGSAATGAWLTGQDALYAEHLAALPGRERLAPGPAAAGAGCRARRACGEQVGIPSSETLAFAARYTGLRL
jgi:Prolyl oligopeptidase, N-terminal beta-propeller domain